jgi:CheY-like chemotaxis protein
MKMFFNRGKVNRILIVDDEPAIVRLLLRLLSSKVHHIDTAANGEEGMRKIQSNPYDVVITDVKMPGISGEKMAIMAKALKGNALKVIAISGTPWLLNSQVFDAVLAKPFTQDLLFKTISDVGSSSSTQI